MENYKCSGTELFAAERKVPVFQANYSELCEETSTESICVEVNSREEGALGYLCEGALGHLCDELRNGGVIVNISDDAQSSKRTLQVLPSHSNTNVNFIIEKFKPGPIHKHSTVDDISDTTYLSADSKIVVIDVDKKTNEDEDDHIVFDLFYIDLRTKEWTSYQFTAPKQRLGSHMFVLHATQVFVCFKIPVEIFIVDFHDRSHVRMHHWREDMKASRFLSCRNFIAIYDSQKYPDDLLCVTVTRNKTSELLVKKPSVLLGECVESLQVINANGRIFLLAQKDSTLFFLTIHQKQFVVSHQLDFTKSTVKKDYTPLIIKNILCWNDSLLYIPIARMELTFPEDDNQLSKGLAIAVVNLHNFEIRSILQINSKVDIYKEVISLALLEHGNTLIVKTLKKSGLKIMLTSNHTFKIFPQTLQSTAVRAIIKKRILLLQNDLPTKIQKIISENLDL